MRLSIISTVGGSCASETPAKPCANCYLQDFVDSAQRLRVGYKYSHYVYKRFHGTSFRNSYWLALRRPLPTSYLSVGTSSRGSHYRTLVQSRDFQKTGMAGVPPRVRQILLHKFR
jgi:hypothetical protein